MNKLIMIFLYFITFNAFATTGIGTAVYAVRIFIFVVLPISIILIVGICVLIYKSIFSSKKHNEPYKSKVLETDCMEDDD